LGKPVNSETMEGFPSVSPDGKQLYFARCQTMTNQNCENCKIWVAEQKSQGYWKEPTELPASINSGNVMYPRILKDGKTLIFSSNKSGGKGGYDLYMSRKSGGSWTEPQNLAFLNTAEDEIFADLPAQTDAIYYASFTDGFLNMYKAKLPEEFQPEKVLLITGKSVNESTKAPLEGYLMVSDNQSLAPIMIERIDSDGKFTAVLAPGKVYDVAVTAGKDYFFWSSTFDALSISRSKREALDLGIGTLKAGPFYHGNKAIFDSTTYQTLPSAMLESRRIAKVIQSHPELKYELVLFPNGVANNPTENASSSFESMKTSIMADLQKTGLSADKFTLSNGSGTKEEEDNYSGWGLRILP
jgi:hypothetical protein